MNNIFKRIKLLFADPSDSSDQEFNDFVAQQRKVLDDLTNMIEELVWKEAMQRKKLEMIEDFLERIGLEIPPPELDDTATEDETTSLLNIYTSIIRKITRPVWEECVKAGTDAVDDLVETVNDQMAELS
ncbi:MAG: hypothetical protein LBL24_03775 [Bacteroidales bacterium]|jgi:hypothetical protein|nr:hypothetical protein [Bacteroidales bacterium]